MIACSKRELNPGTPATIQVYNALNDGAAVYMDFSGKRPAGIQNKPPDQQ